MCRGRSGTPRAASSADGSEALSVVRSNEVPELTQNTTVRAGRFHQGRLSGGRPQALDAWRVTTDDADMAAQVAGLLGGEPQSNGGGSGGLAYEVLTSRESVRVLLDGPDAVAAHMVLWGSEGIVH